MQRAYFLYICHLQVKKIADVVLFFSALKYNNVLKDNYKFGIDKCKFYFLSQDGTRNLQLHGHQVLRERNYDEIVENFTKQEVCSAASTWMSHFLGTVSLCIIVVIILNRLLNC